MTLELGSPTVHLNPHDDKDQEKKCSQDDAEDSRYGEDARYRG
jgi:hypothetical protein